MLGLLLSCETPTVVDPDDRASERPDERVGGVEGPGGLAPGGGGGEHRDASELFGLTTVHTVDVELSAEAYDTLLRSSYETLHMGTCAEVPGRVAIDGEWLPSDVAVSVKGRWGSGRTLDQKASLKIDLDQFDEDQRFLGLKQLTLNNMVNDPSYVHEALAYRAFEGVGVPSLRTGYAWVRLNGADYGLLLNVETPDDEWLERVYAEPSGNLYDSDYLIWPDGSYTLVDFDPASDVYFDLEEGVDVGRADVRAVTDAVSAAEAGADYTATVGARVDLDEYLTHWATELWVGHWDGYNYNRNNYRVYFDPLSGRRAQLLPWGLDWTFDLEPRRGDVPISRLGAACSADATCRDAMQDRLEDVSAELDALSLTDTLDEAVALVEPFVAADPRREVDVRTVRAYQESTRSWIEGRSAALLSR